MQSRSHAGLCLGEGGGLRKPGGDLLADFASGWL